MMDEETRRIIAEAYALDDAARRDYEVHQRSAPLELVYKTNHDALLPQPQTRSSTMDPQTQAAWDNWLDRRVAQHLEEFADLVGEECGAALKVELVKLRTEIGQLRADIEILRQHKANVTPLRGRDVA